MPYKDKQKARDSNKAYREKNQDRWRSERRKKSYPLGCGHCGAIFMGTYHQRKHQKYDGLSAYCSEACRLAGERKKKCKPVPEIGPCLTCGNMFHSRNLKKIFCSMSCYVQSRQFKKMLREARQKSMTPESIAKRARNQRTGTTIKCLECGADVYQKKKQKRKFCTQVCYRAYLSKRFDRFVSNPEEISLPQCYDEFLDQDELPCLIDGCDWIGVHLTVHMNLAHGMRKEEFKRAAGFNLGSGIIGRRLAELFQGRENRGIAKDDYIFDVPPWELCSQNRESDVIRYFSNEAHEHRLKSRALTAYIPGPVRTCAGCGNDFRQSSICGRAKYCSIDCRENTYAAKRRAKSKTRHKNPNGTFYWS